MNKVLDEEGVEVKSNSLQGDVDPYRFFGQKGEESRRSVPIL